MASKLKTAAKEALRPVRRLRRELSRLGPVPQGTVAPAGPALLEKELRARDLL